VHDFEDYCVLGRNAVKSDRNWKPSTGLLALTSQNIVPFDKTFVLQYRSDPAYITVTSGNVVLSHFQNIRNVEEGAHTRDHGRLSV
jgi:hypothetical protein